MNQIIVPRYVYFYDYIMTTTEDLIIFEEEDSTTTKRISKLEHIIETLLDEINNLHGEMTILRQELYNHITAKPEKELSSRFTIQHIPKYLISDSSSSDAISIEI